ncbi:MAG: hypothetical protein C5B50_16370 [Verrucomicrobia bacterium]|nr:MAG: hypothetical protein C5B50_16370 [Verrucomicrobiota bacterium]
MPRTPNATRLLSVSYCAKRLGVRQSSAALAFAGSAQLSFSKRGAAVRQSHAKRLPSALVQSDVNESSGFRRLLGWRGLLLLLGLLVLGIFLFYAEEDWRGRRAWEKYRTEARTRGELPDASALVPPRVLDSENFAMTPFLAPLYDFLAGTQTQRDTNAVARVYDFPHRFNAASLALRAPKEPASNSWFKARTDLIAWQAAYQQGRNKQSRDREGATVTNELDQTAPISDPAANQKAARAVLEDLSECDPVLQEIAAASTRPYSRFNIRYENEDPAAILLPHLAVMKRLSLVLQLRASAHLALDQSDLAFKDIDLSFRLVDATRDEPLIISQLVRLAQLGIVRQPLAEGLARHQWSGAQLQAIQQRLARLDLCGDLKHTFDGERVLLGDKGIEWIQAKPYSRFKLICQLPFPDKPNDYNFDAEAALVASMPKGWFYFERLNYNRLLEDSILGAIDSKTRTISPAACREADLRYAKLSRHAVFRHQVFSALLLPSLTRAVQRTAYGQAGVDAMMVACALERYRLAHGAFPETLEKLVPEFVPKLPHDIINGQPLKYRRTEDGLYVLYSVGWNETDDGGTVAMKGKDGQVDWEKGDWVWRLEK